MEKRSILARLGFGDPHGAQASELYGRVVTAAREPALYTHCGVPDTPVGRYEMLSLHMVLLLERLKTAGPEGAVLSQRVAEAFVTDMDDCLREMGVGDLTVPKKVKKAAAGLYERAGAYRPDAAGGTPTAEVRRNALAASLADALPQLQHPQLLAAYFEEAEKSLAACSPADILGGRFTFPACPPRPRG